MYKIKQWLKRFTPVSKLEYQQHTLKQMKVQEKNLHLIMEALKQNQEQTNQNQQQLNQNQAQLLQKLDDINGVLSEEQKKIRNALAALERTANETLWAEIWNNTITESSWLEQRSFSPGRFAVGYPFLYVLYRILDEVKPQSILELGLGQSTKMLSQYAKQQSGATHKVVESDKEWIDFFSKNYAIPSNTEIVYLETEIIEKEPGQPVRVFKEFESTFQAQKFDYICIDAPRGDLSNFSRIDILPLLPHCLKENFIIMVHDCQRIGERNTVAAIKSILAEYRISFHEKNYKGIVDTIVLCSDDLKFITTL